MNPVLNYFLCFSDDIYTLMTVKLTAFYHKLITGYTNRLIMVVSLNDTIRHDRNIGLYDERTIARFDPANTMFWEKRFLHQYGYFLSNSSNVYVSNAFIQSGCVFNNLSDVQYDDADITVASIKQDSGLMEQQYGALSSILGLSGKQEALTLYDLSFFYISEQYRLEFQHSLTEVILNHPGYVNHQESHAILSIIISLLASQGAIIKVLDLSPFSIKPDDIQDFYCFD